MERRILIRFGMIKSPGSSLVQVAIFFVVSFLGFTSSVWGIPSTFPHDHNNPGTTDHDTTWINPTPPPEVVADPDPDNPNTKAHQHRDRHPLNGQFRRGGDVTDPVTTDNNETPANPNDDLGFGTYAVWDDRNWRYDRPNDRSLPEYAHGFIQQGADTAVRYHFIDLFDDDRNPRTPGVNRWFTNPTAMNMRTSVNDAYMAWEAAVNGEGVNVNGVAIITSINFTEVAVAAAAEINVLLGGGRGSHPVRWNCDFRCETTTTLMIRFPSVFRHLRLIRMETALTTAPSILRTWHCMKPVIP